ncbi:MAG: hypothetical protein Q9159_000479 [Coniocarpon cinnabarinum]
MVSGKYLHRARRGRLPEEPLGSVSVLYAANRAVRLARARLRPRLQKMRRVRALSKDWGPTRKPSMCSEPETLETGQMARRVSRAAGRHSLAGPVGVQLAQIRDSERSDSDTCQQSVKVERQVS